MRNASLPAPAEAGRRGSFGFAGGWLPVFRRRGPATDITILITLNAMIRTTSNPNPIAMTLIYFAVPCFGGKHGFTP